jgi:cystathionine beta-lyase
MDNSSGNELVMDFDSPIDRRQTDSMKWEKYRGRDVIPLWVADMDFRSPPSVIDALSRHAAHGVFGYSTVPPALVDVVQSRLDENYGWKVDKDWLVWIPGLVTGLNIACRAVGNDHDGVITAVPVYPPFLKAPEYSRRHLITVPLALTGGRWEFDLDRFDAAIVPSTRLFILCNPHNPVGRVFNTGELTALAGICEKHDLTVCADEIHCDLILDSERRHIPFAMLSQEVADRTITLMAPSKTYNIPGLGCSFAVISNPHLRKCFKEAMRGIVPLVNAMGFTAALAAYRSGSEWLSTLLEYLRRSRDIVAVAVEQMPVISATHVEATYLTWIDTRETGIEDPVAFFEAAGVGLSDGREFGGPGYVRLNFGCPHALLQHGLERMHRALEQL